MKKAAITFFACLFGLNICFAQAADGIIVNPKTAKQEKGPKFKNQHNPARGISYSLVSSAEMTDLKGPEFKNKKANKASGQEIKVKTYTSKGPKYKFQRFHN